MTTVTISLIKPMKRRVIRYTGDEVERGEHHVTVRAVWSDAMGRVDLGYVVFEPGDYLYETFYDDRWYNVFELHAPDHTLKGWYCNITRPARFLLNSVVSEDLELDLFVSPDRSNVLLLDEDEYAARGLADSEPLADVEVQAAVGEIRGLAHAGAPPFVARTQPYPQLYSHE